MSENQKIAISRKIARYVTNMRIDDVYEGGVERAKQCFLDTLGLALGAKNEPAVRLMKKTIDEMGSTGPSLVLGFDEHMATVLAARINGVAAHVADYDDNSSLSTTHPSCVLVPACYGAAEYVNASGVKMLEGFIVGFEVSCSLGRAAGWAHYNLGWHPTSTFGTLAATCAVAKIMGLSENEIVNAFGIASSSVGGIRQNFGTMCKSYHAGNAASAALFACILAKNGYDAAEDAMEGKSGYFSTMNFTDGTMEAFDWLGRDYTETLGHQFFKLYPSCAMAHTPIEAARQLVKDNGIDFDSIESIDCYMRPVVPTQLIYSDPKTGLEAKFSLEYNVASMLITGECSPVSFEDENVGNPKVRAFMPKVHMHTDERLEDIVKQKGILAPCIVKIAYDNGKTVSLLKETASGGFDDPATWEDLEIKFHAVVCKVIEDEQEKQIVRLCKSLDQIEINELQKALEIH
ncbi:MmgE/PrpD family protein [Adlercreutzia sp. ZJ304]|uniref:MmgE/PrpD family protein n=1 Tax=Adlercreutzia sp. ZJ304 TaxID=2709791 RepID=UPI0013E9D440|nr:MmgE/PrpD family protein [Adlercreutzia sp. ZJ304]